MVCGCGKNWWVSYGQKGVDGGREVSGERVQGRPRLGWMEGVKVALGNSRLSVNSRKIVKSGEPWYKCNWMSFTPPFLLCPVFFRTALPFSGGYLLGRDRIALHDPVGINLKRAQLLNIKVQMPSIWADWCMLMIVCVLSDLTWIPLLGEGWDSRNIIILLLTLYTLNYQC